MACLLLLASCGERTARNQGVYMLIDTLRTYTQVLDKSQQVINDLERLEKFLL